MRGFSHGAPDAGDDHYASHEQDELMSEMILKHRSELQKFVERTMPLVSTSTGAVGGSASSLHTGGDDSVSRLLFSSDHDHLPPRLEDDRNPHDEGYYDTPLRPARSKAGERLMQLSRTERTDRMKLAELSDVRNEKLGRAAILKWNPNAKPSHDRESRTYHGNLGGRDVAPRTPRTRSNTSPPRTTPKILREYTKDYVQKAIDFSSAGMAGIVDESESHADVEDDDDDDDLPPPSPRSLREMIERKPQGKRETKAVRKYVKHMESTIAQLVQQKDELQKNQAEFDKHASGMFPTLETLNDQLSQLVQDRLMQSQVNIKDDMDNELRSIRERLNELELETKQRRNDAEILEQKRDIDIAQVKSEIASWGTTGVLQTQKLELLTSQVRKLQQDMQESIQVIQSVTEQYRVIDKRVNSLQVNSSNGSIEPQPQQRRLQFYLLAAFLVLVIAVGVGVLFGNECSGRSGRCHPLT
ncbi:hypothetical protein Poli38472_002139 [Pythium oligandrum]|uniref:Uncharacterized protein n=1 Tax=Pythium oligandrum TaxID=41045 RepID=A0A8K1CHQ9_PYTOL|nr:hypothetical protein Poli38472_002139 [Pythium oligandrum]|eukprot:TMW63198.1 hypothetical protein Poli38472_002139 [Pythium oligandrum]